MDVRVGFLLLCVLVSTWDCNARQLMTSDISDLQMSYQEQDRDDPALEKLSGNDNVCTLCEEYASQAIDYLSANETQTEIIDTLHTTCSRVRSFQQQCTTLVDYYASLFFLEISSIQPEELCLKINLCEQMRTTSPPHNKDSCGICHQAVSEILLKLKDPDTQLEILELLLKGCDAMENYVKKCKRMVFEYGPLIITNVEKYLETTDVCATFHACTSPSASNKQELSMVLVPSLSDS